MSSNFRAERAFKMPSLHQAPLLHRGDLIANLLSAKLPSAADNGLFKVKADRQHCFLFTSDLSSPAKLLDPSLNSTLSVTTANSSFRAASATNANNAKLVSIQSLLQAVLCNTSTCIMMRHSRDFLSQPYVVFTVEYFRSR